MWTSIKGLCTFAIPNSIKSEYYLWLIASQEDAKNILKLSVPAKWGGDQISLFVDPVSPLKISLKQSVSSV
jgi:hypothetical protein